MLESNRMEYTMNRKIKTAATILAMPFRLAWYVLLIPFVKFILGDAAECVADGIVPANKRYDFDFRKEVEDAATGKAV